MPSGEAQVPGEFRVRMRARGEVQGGLFLGRFYSSKWLAFPVFGHKKGPSIIIMIIFIQSNSKRKCGAKY